MTFRPFLAGLAALVLWPSLAFADELADLSSTPPVALFKNQPLGLPEVIWWLLLLIAICAGFYVASKYCRWLRERLVEPSTNAALAAFFGVGGAYVDSLRLDPSAFGQALMLVGVWFGALALITKEKGNSR